MMFASTNPRPAPMRLVVTLLAASTLASCATTASPVPAPRRSPAVSLAGAPAVPLAKEKERYLTILVGLRSMIGNEWDGVDTPTVVGLTYDIRTLGQSFGLEAGGMVSYDDSDKGSTDIDATILEGFIGMRNTWGYDGSVMRPYWAIGAAIMRIRVDSAQARRRQPVQNDRPQTPRQDQPQQHRHRADGCRHDWWNHHPIVNENASHQSDRHRKERRQHRTEARCQRVFGESRLFGKILGGPHVHTTIGDDPVMCYQRRSTTPPHNERPPP